ncbi:MAG: hypothetical protein EXR74_09510 [Bdellovibrionales bacterium]|nr:hypothetical protein [Bdellovibrionales bacterium]
MDNSKNRKMDNTQPEFEDSEKATRKTKTKVKPVPKTVRAVPEITTLKDFISYYRKTLESLGQKKEDGSYLVEQEDVDLMKQQFGRLLQIEPSALTFLVNPVTQGAWFGNCTLVMDKKLERIIIVASNGDYQSPVLKDKIWGGLYKTLEGEMVFLSSFYGDLQKKVPYRVLWGASDTKVISFVFDRSKEGSVEAQVRGPKGGLLNISRKGRDNHTLQVNGQNLTPIFE